MKDAPRAALLTGEKGCGKTTLCAGLAAASKAFSGILSPRIVSVEGRELGRLARSIKSGEEWELARIDVELDGPRKGRFFFSRQGIERAIACIRNDLADEKKTVVIDEIGPLELDLGLGFAPALPLLQSAGDLLIVAREELVPRISSLLPRHVLEVFTLTRFNRDGIAVQIQEHLHMLPGADAGR